MTPEMLAPAQAVAEQIGLTNVEFRPGVAEELPVDDARADTVIANGLLNVVTDKQRAFTEIWRVVRPGGARNGSRAGVRRVRVLGQSQRP